MAENQKDNFNKLREEVIKNGGIFAKLYFQLFGKTEEGLINLAKGFSGVLVKAKGVKLGATEIAKPERLEDGYYSTYLESYLLLESPQDLFELVADTTPFSIEIIEPEEITLRSGKLEEILYVLSSYTFELKKRIFEANPKEATLMKKMALERVRLGEKIKEGKGDESNKDKD